MYGTSSQWLIYALVVRTMSVEILCHLWSNSRLLHRYHNNILLFERKYLSGNIMVSIVNEDNHRPSIHIVIFNRSINVTSDVANYRTLSVCKHGSIGGTDRKFLSILSYHYSKILYIHNKNLFGVIAIVMYCICLYLPGITYTFIQFV